MIRLTTLAAALLSLPVNAQTLPCATRDVVVARLAQYGEVQAGLGLNGAGNLMELWASAETGSWTIVMTTADGRSCIMSTGHDWVDPLPARADKPA